MALFEINPERRALITGGASGFGLAVARKLKMQGVAVAIADIDRDRLSRGAAELGGAVDIAMDVTSRASVEDGVAKAVDRLGGLDTLVTSAGVFRYGAFAEISEADWDWTVDINLKGTFLACQAALPTINRSGRGRVVTIASISGKRAGALDAHYSASKFGVIGLTQSLALEAGAFGTTANAVCPGIVPTTGMGREATQQKTRLRSQDASAVARSDAANTPIGRLGTPDDVADSVLFLITENAAWITGHALVVDGGQLLAWPRPQA